MFQHITDHSDTAVELAGKSRVMLASGEIDSPAFLLYM